MAMKKLASQVYQHNAAMNLAKKLYEEARKELLGAMKEAGLLDFRTTATIGDAKITLEAAVSTPEVEYIDVAKLQAQVPADKFLLMVTATKKAVETHAGKGTIAQCVATKPGAENVSVGVAKV